MNGASRPNEGEASRIEAGKRGVGAYRREKLPPKPHYLTVSAEVFANRVLFATQENDASVGRASTAQSLHDDGYLRKIQRLALTKSVV